MKPFNLEEAKSGKSVQTKDGRDVRIICFDRKGRYPVVALFEENGATNGYDGSVEESIIFCTKDGRQQIVSCKSDLVMKTERKTMWINIYGPAPFSPTGILFKTKEEAQHYAQEGVITQAEVTWEE